jgi:hypothetical protein
MTTVNSVAENAAAAMPRLNGASRARSHAKSSRNLAKASKATVKPGRRVKRAVKRAK